MTPRLTDVSHPTRQQLFDAIVEHAAQMPGKSWMNPDAKPCDQSCAYRSPDGNACFIGGLLTDEEANGLDAITAAWVEDPRSGPSGAYEDLLYAGKMPERLSRYENRDFLQEMQRTHDTLDPGQWPEAFRQRARDFGLDASIVDRCFPTVEA